MSARQRSAGHIGWVDEVEFYEVGGQVYRAPESSVFDLTTGARIGRWECSRPMFDAYREVVAPRLEVSR